MTHKNPSANTDIVAEFFSEITRDWSEASDQEEFFEIRCLGEDQKPITQLFTINTLDQAVDLAARMNLNGLNTYMMINPINGSTITEGKSATDNDILRAHFSFADADDENGLKGLNKLAQSLVPDISVITGTVPCERRHDYWRLNEPCCNLERWRRVQAEIADQFGTDKAVINPSRIMRIAGTVAYPNAKKRAKGYVDELVSMHLRAS